MDVNVKGLEPAVLARLAEQAAIEGMSQQEWLRKCCAARPHGYRRQSSSRSGPR